MRFFSLNKDFMFLAKVLEDNVLFSQKTRSENNYTPTLMYKCNNRVLYKGIWSILLLHIIFFFYITSKMFILVKNFSMDYIFLLLFLDYPQDEWTLSFQEVNFFFFYLKCEILLSPRVKCMVSKLILYEHMALLFLAIFNILLSWNILLNFSEMPFV